jgi:16S rRNA C1402 (ribose-2'-O) methylase RsmI
MTSIVAITQVSAISNSPTLMIAEPGAELIRHARHHGY